MVNGIYSKICKLKYGKHVGWISPLTECDKIVVNGVSSSCHTMGPHNMVCFIYKPLKIFLHFFPNKVGKIPELGYENWFAIKYRRGPIGRFLTWALNSFY
jgi:hypothetical protein